MFVGPCTHVSFLAYDLSLITTPLSFSPSQDFVVAAFQSIPGVNLSTPKGAFYVLPEMSAFFGPGAAAVGFGAVPDSDTFCRYLIEIAHVSVRDAIRSHSGKGIDRWQLGMLDMSRVVGLRPWYHTITSGGDGRQRCVFWLVRCLSQVTLAP